jgi:hypothetical protein
VSSTQARLDLSFNTKVPGIFGADRTAENGHPFKAIDTYDKWVSLGSLKKDLDSMKASMKAHAMVVEKFESKLGDRMKVF